MECVQYVVWAMLVECFLMMLTNHGEPDHALQNWYNQYVANKTRAESQTHYPMYTHTNSCKNKNAKQYSAMAFCGTGAGWIVLPSVTFILKHTAHAHRRARKDVYTSQLTPSTRCIEAGWPHACAPSIACWHPVAHYQHCTATIGHCNIRNAMNWEPWMWASGRLTCEHCKADAVRKTSQQRVEGEGRCECHIQQLHSQQQPSQADCCKCGVNMADPLVEELPTSCPRCF